MGGDVTMSLTRRELLVAAGGAAAAQITIPAVLRAGSAFGVGADPATANRNRLVVNYPFVNGVKTGHSFEAGFNFLGSVERQGRRVVLVIAGAPTEPGRAAAARKLAQWSFEAWDGRAFLEPGSSVGTARVQGGAARQVQLGVPRRFALAVSHGSSAKVSGTIEYLGPLRAPLAKGEQVARLTVHLEGQPDHELPLVTLEAVGAAGPIDRIIGGLLGLLE